MINLYEFEEKYHQLGYVNVAGTDEVGRGPLAGPLVCAAVILNPTLPIEGLNDSKKLSETKREILSELIKEKALAYSIVYIDEKTIDEVNIYQASKLGMLKAIQQLSVKPDMILSDAMPLGDVPHEAIIKGDALSASIAAASIIAKVERDQFMVKLSARYPQYGFEKHKGYPTKMHLEMIQKYGIVEIHRKSYKPVYDAIHHQLSLKI